MKKTIAVIAMLSMVFVAAPPIDQARAQTVAELQAQINSLLNTLNQLQAQLSALQGVGTTTPPQSFIFTRNLTIGSRGQDVTQLQLFLVARGFLVMPQGVAFGYFGPLTRAALARFQASQSISPAVGFFGPITRARVNVILASQTPTTPPTTPTTTPPGGITTPGIEGIMSVTSNNSGLRSSIFEGEQRVPLLGIEVEARRSDIAVQRVTLDLGQSSTLYNRVLSRLYVTDGTNVLASIDLNQNTIIREGNNFTIVITGFDYIVPRDSTRTLVIQADVRPVVDTENQGSSFTIQLANNGVRGIDGAGIDHFAPATGSTVSRSFTVQEGLAESARLLISLASNTPRTQEVIADAGVNDNEADRVPVLSIDLRAERDDIIIRDMTVNLTQTGTGTANILTAYLFDGSTEVDSASVSGGTAVFRDIDYTVPRGTTRTLSIRVDVRNVTSTLSFITASIPSGGIVAENVLGDIISSGDIRGSAQGYQIGFRNIGPEVTLASKSITTSGVPQDATESSILTASFNVRVRATGGDIVMGTIASTTPAFDTDSFSVFRNGVPVSVDPSFMAISYTIPSGANTAGLTNSFRISEGNEVTIPVTVQLRGRVGGTALPFGIYAIGLDNITWISNGTILETNFMEGEIEWRTNDVSFP